MQYILTQEELSALQSRADAGDAIKRSMPSIKELQALCSLVADHVPVKSGWYKGKVWGCILTTRKGEGEEQDYSDDYEWYCDDCPAQKACPYNYKQFSK